MRVTFTVTLDIEEEDDKFLFSDHLAKALDDAGFPLLMVGVETTETEQTQKDTNNE